MKKILVSLLLIFSCSVRAEVIDSYDAVIRVNPDASATVTETIVVNVEGRQIRRGLVRFLPEMKDVSYSVSGVERDGKKEPFFIEKKRGKFIINTGNDSFLPHKTTTFSITYTAKNVILFFTDHDELYWNVTGDQWDFPIKRATAKVILPDGAETTETSAFVGVRGSKENGLYDKETGVFSSGRELRQGEGMTIVVSFPKNFAVYKKSFLKKVSEKMSAKGFAVHKKSFSEKMSETMSGVAGSSFFVRLGAQIDAILNALPLALIAYVSLIAYLIVTWLKYGLDPTKLSAMPRFDTVPDMTPAQVAYVYRHGAGSWSLLALLQSCANKFLEIKPLEKRSFFEKDSFLIKKLREPQTDEERLIDSELTLPKELNGKYSPQLHALESSLASKNEKAYGKYYIRNTKYYFYGLLLSLMFIALFCYLGMEGGPIIVAYLITASFVPFFTDTFARVFLYIFATVWLFYPFGLRPDLMSAYPLAAFNLLFLYSFLIGRPTDEGLRIIEHVDGIKMFLKAVQMYPTSFEDMEKLMPYAVFLKLEKQYDEKMKAFAEIKNLPPPTWHTSRPNYSQLRNSISTAAKRPSSSGHHGSSGGGFGGGGGGGR